MPQRLPGILLVLTLAGAAPAYAQTKSTPMILTTIPGGGCAPEDATLSGIDCRLAALRDAVFYATDSLGRLWGSIRFPLQTSARCLTRATALCDGRLDADANRAREKLRQCVRPLVVVLAKLRSNYARRVIPPDLAATLASEVDGLASDLKAARTSLTCP